KYDYRFKHMTTVGEPIEPEVWRWYHDVVGKGEAVIVDTWWQTENGGFLGSTLPGLQAMKPGSCGPGVLGVSPVVYDGDGNEGPAGSGKAGNICIRNPWPGIFQTIWGQPERFVDTYYAKYCRDRKSTDWRDWPYFAGDGAVQAADGYFRILGRVDDVINVAGHRLGTKELESASLTVEEIAEAAAVPVIDELRGRVVQMYVALKPGIARSQEIEAKVAKAIETQIGKIARPKSVGSSRTCPRPAPGRSCRGSSPEYPTSPTWATPPRWRISRSSTESATTSKARRRPAGRCHASCPGQKIEEIKAFGQADWPLTTASSRSRHRIKFQSPKNRLRTRSCAPTHRVASSSSLSTAPKRGTELVEPRRPSRPPVCR